MKLPNQVIRERLFAKREIDADGCWIWTGSRLPSGYGQMWNGERPEGTHRLAFRAFVGPLPEGTEPDHLCRKRGCFNPACLEAVTHRENMRRGTGFAGRQAAQTECKRGHPLAGANLRIDAAGGRQCRVCDNRRAAAYRAQRRAARG